MRLSTATVSEIEIELRRLNGKLGYAEPLPSWLRGRGTQHRAIEDFVGELVGRILVERKGKEVGDGGRNNKESVGSTIVDN